VTTGVANYNWDETQELIKDTKWSLSASKCIWACNNLGKVDSDGNDANKIIWNTTKEDPAECTNYNLGSKRHETSDKKMYARSSAAHLCFGKCESLVDKPLSVIYENFPQRYHLNEDNVCGNGWMPSFVSSEKMTDKECKAHLDKIFGELGVGGVYSEVKYKEQPYVMYDGGEKPVGYNCNTNTWEPLNPNLIEKPPRE
jgi:hypothetical protein